MLTINQCKLIGVYDQSDAKKLQKKYGSYDELVNDLKVSPYHIFINVLHWSFPYADKLIEKKWQNKHERCLYGMAYVLRTNANAMGSTKMKASEMYVRLRNLIGKDAEQCVEIIKEDNENVFHYDNDNKIIGLKSLYDCEKNIANAIKERLRHNAVNADWNIEQYRHTNGMTFTDEQMKILELARDNGVCILSGGAGTGKSAVTKALVNMLEDNCQSYQLLAPTGIAAKRLRDATGRDAMTIHMYLFGARCPLDYLIIDEFSMIGVELLNMLLNHPDITDETRLIFICDEAQLASISPGNIIKNLLDFNKIPMAKLTKVFRYGQNGIATYATDIRNGKEPNYQKKWETAMFYPYSQYADLDCYEEYIENAKKYDGDVLLLTPKKIGKYGTYRLNRLIQEHMTVGKHLAKFDYIIKDRGQEYPVSFNIGDKVINVKNNYHALTSDGKCGMIMNGEIGIVTRVKNIDGDDCLCVQFDNDEIAYSKKEIRNLQLAYALTCHKVQGQQAKCVIFLAHEDSAFMLTRNLMYVAVSRAQEMLYIIGNENVIADGVKKVETNNRQTWLLDILQEVS